MRSVDADLSDQQACFARRIAAGLRRYNPRKRKIEGNLNSMKLALLIAAVASGVMGLMASAATAPSQWEQPAAALAEQIAGILGPGQAHLTLRNLSTIPADEIPSIRRLLEQDLKAHGVTISEAESANVLRVTLSENLRERVWVAEIVEGNETRVAMVHVDLKADRSLPAQTGIELRSKRLWGSSNSASKASWPSIEPVLGAIETGSGLVVLEQEQIVVISAALPDGEQEQRFKLGQRQSMSRDPRGILLPSADGDGFTAFAPGIECAGTHAHLAATATRDNVWSVQCHESDDPWPIATGPIARTDASNDTTSLKAFYNAARDYFTGVVTPSLGVDPPPFYTAALLPRSSGAAFLFNGIDGKVQLVESGTLKPVSGTRDWGSDFAALNSGCGAGTQIVASGSGEALNDSLRAYVLPAQEAVPASAPLAMEGTVTALWSAPDGKSVFAVVRRTAGAGVADSYEVDRVTASCNE
jgi:hypothetical protein